jgi:hypothetical protein
MNYRVIFCIVIFLVLTGCAAQEEPVSAREPKSLITKDDYEDLKIKPKDETVEVEYKQGKIIQSIDNAPTKAIIQHRFLDVASFGSVKELKTRYEKGARLNFHNYEGKTALIKVLEGPYNEQTYLKLEYLVSAGSLVNFKGKGATSNSTTPLNVAVWNSSSVLKSDTASSKPYFAEQILKYLIAEGAYLSGTDDNGRAPLHTAARSNNLVAARLLLESGADVMQKDFDEKTPLYFAESREMKKLLKEHGAVEIKYADPEDALLHDANEQERDSLEIWEPLRDIKRF